MTERIFAAIGAWFVIAVLCSCLWIIGVAVVRRRIEAQKWRRFEKQVATWSTSSNVHVIPPGGAS